MSQVKAVCFDLGGVLIQIHHTWDSVLTSLSLDCDRELGPLGGFDLFEQYQSGSVGHERYAEALAEYVCCDTATANGVHMAILRDEYPGVSDLVRELVGQGIVCGCVSNTNEAHWRTFFDGVRYGFGPMLSVRIGSHNVKLCKPDEAIFRLFECETGFAGPDIVYFDDNAENVRAASALDWRAHLIDPSADTADQMRRFLRA